MTLALLCLLGSLLACNTPDNALEQATLAITSVHVIDAERGLQENRTVFLRDDKILAVHPAGEVAVPDQVPSVDGSGKYLIPGLWDAHVHLAFEPDISPAMFRLFLVNGITSIRDTGGKLDLVKPWKDAAAAAPESAPRVMIAGPLIDGRPRVYDGSSPGRPELAVEAGTVEEVRAIVAELDAAGVDLLKAYEMLSPPVYRALLEEAEKRGLPVTGHVPLSMDVVSASSAGLRSIEHMRNLEMSCTDNWEQLLEVRRVNLREGRGEAGGDLRSRLHQMHRTYAIEHADSLTRAGVLAALAENGTWLVPTLTIVMARVNRVYARESWREQYQYLPDSAAARWTRNSLVAADLPIDTSSRIFAAWGQDMVSRLPAAGVGIMAGTDCPIAFLTPGFSLHEELRLLVESGLTPIQALEAATVRPAEYFNLQDSLGTIESGKLADLVLLRANPLEDITNTQTIESVIRAGKLYDRSALDAWLSELAAE